MHLEIQSYFYGYAYWLEVKDVNTVSCQLCPNMYEDIDDIGQYIDLLRARYSYQ